MARSKTKAEKVRSGYRLKNFKLIPTERSAAKDASEFGYLSSEYVKQDLTKTFLFTAIMLGLLMIAKKYLG